LSWADWERPNATAWFDRMMSKLDAFDVTVTFCFTPEAAGIHPHHTSPPRNPDEFASFCATMLRRYHGAGAAGSPRLVTAAVG
jgi:beta-xylosidase